MRPERELWTDWEDLVAAGLQFPVPYEQRSNGGLTRLLKILSTSAPLKSLLTSMGMGTMERFGRPI